MLYINYMKVNILKSNGHLNFYLRIHKLRSFKMLNFKTTNKNYQIELTFILYFHLVSLDQLVDQLVE